FRVVDSGNRTVLIGGIEVRSNGCCRNEVGISLNQTDDITNEVHSDGLPLLKLVAQRTVTARPSKNIYYIDKVIIGIGEDNLVLDARTAEQYLNS
ncbi:MAG: hypothetical protein OXQ96_00580, partial [Alphaproteobacteria bacterium]|nr:hypothetical protein [Alphaproteobacteria bacterium]